jgi:hypothetical protein
MVIGRRDSRGVDVAKRQTQIFILNTPFGQAKATDLQDFSKYFGLNWVSLALTRGNKKDEKGFKVVGVEIDGKLIMKNKKNKMK